MTIKQIAEKYGIPYNVVYQGTYGVTTNDCSMWGREFPEEEVIENVVGILQARIEKYEAQVKWMRKMLKQIKERSKTE